MYLLWPGLLFNFPSFNNAQSNAQSFSRSYLAKNSLRAFDLNNILFSEATAEHSGRQSELDAAFFSAIEEQWGSNIALTNSTKTSPYIVCDNSNGDGFLRGRNVEKVLKLQDNLYEIVYNSHSMSCFLASLRTDQALQFTENIIITPMNNKMKMAVGTLSNIGSLPYGSVITYTAVFCPSVLAGKVNNKEKLDSAKIVKKQIRASLRQVSGSCIFGSSVTIRLMENIKGINVFVNLNDISIRCLRKIIDTFSLNNDVCSFSYESPNVFEDIVSNQLIQGGSARTNYFHQVGIMGQGQIAQVSDSGCSVNSCYFYDSNKEVERNKSGVFDLSIRKIVQYYANGDATDDNSHGTHVSSILAGNKCSGCVGQSSSNGAAPEAKLAIFDILEGNSGGLKVDHANKMFGKAITAGALVHSASWGPEDGNPYYSNTDKDWDKYIYDNEYYVVFKAAGNYGKDNKKFSISGTAKNIVTVGSTNSYPAWKGENYVSWFSGRGPSKDGRIKPDICAPGNKIEGSGNGSARSCYSRLKSGTSMSCPGAAGAGLLVRQYFSEGWYPSGSKIFQDAFYPTGTLLKAVLVNSGRALLGVDNVKYMTKSVPFDMHQGFGRITLIDSLYLKGKNDFKMHVVDKKLLSKNGSKYTRTFEIGTCSTPTLSVTLVWADKENGFAGCRMCIVNRLCLKIEKSNVMYFPNGLASCDERNNVQRIRLPASKGDTFNVTVETNNLYTESQTFSLVATGCLISNNPGHDVSPSFGEFEYFYNHNKLSWHDHFDFAKQWGGHLASVHSDKENYFIGSLIFDKASAVWIGGTQTRNQTTWNWSDDSLWDFEMLESGQTTSIHQKHLLLKNKIIWNDALGTALNSAVYKRRRSFSHTHSGSPTLSLHSASGDYKSKWSSKSPSELPSVGCKDDKDFIYHNRGDCNWVSTIESKRRKRRVCNKRIQDIQTQAIVFTRTYCPVACGICDLE